MTEITGKENGLADLVPATSADLAAVASLMNRAYRGGGKAVGWTTETAYLAGDRTTQALLRADVEAKPDALLMTWRDRSDDTLMGCVWLEPVGEGVWYLGSLAVAPDRQKAGLGHALLLAAEQWLRKKGATRVRMTVINIRDTLIAWYERRGYQATGETIAFPYGDNRFGTPLRDDLAFVVLEKAIPTV